MLENQKTSAVNFMISHPGLSYMFVQESPTFQTSSEHFALSFVGIRKEKENKTKEPHLTESILSVLEVSQGLL